MEKVLVDTDRSIFPSVTPAKRWVIPGRPKWLPPIFVEENHPLRNTGDLTLHPGGYNLVVAEAFDWKSVCQRLDLEAEMPVPQGGPDSEELDGKLIHGCLFVCWALYLLM